MSQSQVIRIPDRLYQRLAVYAGGFETPANVIEKILAFYEEAHPVTGSAENTVTTSEIEPAISLEVVYYLNNKPVTEIDFKKQLLITKLAYIKMHYTNNSSEIKEWNASRFSDSSRIDTNLRSGYLRGWKERGLYKAELAIDRHDIT